MNGIRRVMFALKEGQNEFIDHDARQPLLDTFYVFSVLAILLWSYYIYELSELVLARTVGSKQTWKKEQNHERCAFNESISLQI